jgi:hypothetical protein
MGYRAARGPAPDEWTFWVEDPTPAVQPSAAGVAAAPVALRKNWFVRHKVADAVVAVLLLGVFTGIAVGSVKGVRAPAKDTSESFIDNPASLSTSVEESLNAKLADSSNDSYRPGVTAESSDCIKETGRQYTCLVKMTDGSSISPVVIVSEDGSTLISHSR